MDSVEFNKLGRIVIVVYVVIIGEKKVRRGIRSRFLQSSHPLGELEEESLMICCLWSKKALRF